MKKYINDILYYLLMGLIGLIILTHSSSCSLMKTHKSVLVDTIHVVKQDTGLVHKSETNTKSDAEYWREIINFLPKGHDTTINNTTVPVNNYYPTQIIKEHGTVQTQIQQVNYDSIFHNLMDSVSHKMELTQSSSKTKVLSFWQILALCAGVGLVFFLLGKVKFSLK